jgi:hypothetical protein
MTYFITITTRRSTQWPHRPVYDAYLNAANGMGIHRRESTDQQTAVRLAGQKRRDVVVRYWQNETRPAPLDWLEGQPCIPPEGEKATAGQWMYWYDKRKREAQRQ